MKISFKKRELVQAIEFLFGLKLKAKQSRQNSKLIKILKSHLEELYQDEQALLLQHAGADENGQPRKKDSHYDIQDIKGFIKDQSDLYDEEIIIEGSAYEDMIKTVKDALDNYDEVVSGETAIVYNLLCEKFEEGIHNDHH